MKRTWTILGVRDVPGSFRWYQSLFGQAETAPAHSYFGQILDSDGTVLALPARVGFARPSLTDEPRSRPRPATASSCSFCVDDFDKALTRARALVSRFERRSPPQRKHSN